MVKVFQQVPGEGGSENLLLGAAIAVGATLIASALAIGFATAEPLPQIATQPTVWQPVPSRPGYYYPPATERYASFGVPLGIDQGRCNTAGAVGAAVELQAAAAETPAKLPQRSVKAAAAAAASTPPAQMPRRLDRMIDAIDRGCIARTLEYAPDRHAVEWQNPSTEMDVRFVPIATYRGASDLYCREFQVETVVGRSKEFTFGTACRQADGTWRSVN